jgi:hypothetical protein
LHAQSLVPILAETDEIEQALRYFAGTAVDDQVNTAMPGSIAAKRVTYMADERLVVCQFKGGGISHYVSRRLMHLREGRQWATAVRFTRQSPLSWH